MHRRFVPLTLLALIWAVALVSSAAATPLGAVIEFSAGLNAGSVPFRIASGADGSLWFSDQGTTKAIGRITTGGTITEYTLPASSVPRQVRVGGDGSLWFTNTSATPSIGRITASGAITEFALPAGSFPNALAVGADGNIWFTDRGTTPALGRITLSGTITMFSSGLNPGSLPNGITPGPDGNLWFTDQGATKALGQVTTTGAITEFSTGLNPGTLPAALTTGPDGNIWFTDQGTIRAIGRMTTSGTITELNSGLNPGSNPIEITPGADGNLWFTDRGTTKAIGRVTPSGTSWTITNFSLPSTSLAGGIRTGPDGNLWFTDNNPSAQAIGQFGADVPAASIVAPVVSGAGHEGVAQTCGGELWSSWAGLQPSLTAFGFDGYQWLLDGSAIAGQTAQSYTPTAGDVGHQLSCTVTVTYTLFPTTVSATSAAVLVQDATAPVLTLPSAIVASATGPAGATVSFAVTATDNVDLSPIVSCTPASGSTFSIGTTTVNCTATDAAGNSASGAFTVKVKGAREQLNDLAAAVRGVGPGRSLAVTVAVAQVFLAHGAIHATCLTLTVFNLEVRAQSGRKIPTVQATALIADANRIRAVLNC